MRDYTPDPRLYELMTILSPDVSEEDIPAQIDTIAGYVTTAGGTINETLRESPWGRRRLAYSIRHDGRDLRDGFYTVHHLTLDPGGVRDIERDLKLNDQVIRFLITHYTPKPIVPGQLIEGGESAPAATSEPVAAEGDVPTTSDAEIGEAVVAVESDEEPESTSVAETEAGEVAAAPVDEAVATESVAEAAPVAEAATLAEVEPEVEVESAAVDTGDSEIDRSAEVAPDVDASESDEPVTVKATDDPVGADAAPSEPTAPAKDTEEA